MTLIEKTQKMKGARFDTNGTPLRDGDDGYFGRVLEDSLGVSENNRPGMDCPEEEVELKTKKKGSAAKTSLFSKEPTWGLSENIPNLRTAILMLGTGGETIRLNTCMSADRTNNLGLKLVVERKLAYLAYEGEPICSWDLDTLLQRAKEKLFNMLLAEHDEKTWTDVKKYMGFKKSSFVELLESGDVVIEFRAKINPYKNRGTCFRMNGKNIHKLYETVEHS
tara:strand:- start:963 stop:1628 length:666 start_codon:yes stop_codon:yes gene_type:complete